MKRHLCRYAGQAFTALLALAAFLLLARISVRFPASMTGLEDDNPQKFHMWATGCSFSYTFTCDPHAADIWMFQTGGGTMLVLPPRPDTPPLPTNRWIGK